MEPNAVFVPYLINAEVELSRITPAGKVYLNALSTFLEFIPFTRIKRSVSQLLDLFRQYENFEDLIPAIVSVQDQLRQRGSVNDALHYLRIWMADYVEELVRYSDLVGIAIVQEMVYGLLNKDAATNFNNSLTYTVRSAPGDIIDELENFTGDVRRFSTQSPILFSSNNYQITNGMLLAEHQLIELARTLPLMVCLDNTILIPSHDIAVGPSDYVEPSLENQYLIHLLNPVISEDQEYDYALITDPRYIQGFLSLIQWSQTILGNIYRATDYWESIDINDHGRWIAGQLQV